MIDKFLIDYNKALSVNDFKNRNGRMFLKKKESYRLIKAVNQLFDKRIKHQRIKKYGRHSRIRTVVREEPIKLGQHLRGEKGNYEPVKLLNCESDLNSSYWGENLEKNFIRTF